MRRSELIGEHFTVRIDIVREHELLLLDVVLIADMTHVLLWITRAAKMPRVLLCYLKFPVLAIWLVLLTLTIELPYWVLIILHLVLGCRHLSSLQIVFAVLSIVLVGKLDHPIPIRPRGDRQIRCVVVARIAVVCWLVHLLSSIHILGQLASELLSSRVLLTVLLLIVHGLVGHLLVVGGAHRLLDNHPSRIRASITLLPQSRRVHLTSRSPGVY